jgi:hypothetical protein
MMPIEISMGNCEKQKILNLNNFKSSRTAAFILQY